MNIRYATMSLLATALVVVTATVTFGTPAANLAAAEQPVPTCVKPTGNPTHLQQVNFADCLQKRTEALLANLHSAPTETVTVTPSPTASPTTTPPSPTPTQTPTQAPTSTPTSTPTAPAGVPTPADFPTLASVGPASDPTVTYSGDCYFDNSDAKLIDSRVVNCENSGGLRFAPDATGFVFRNSIIRGQMFTSGNTPGDPGADNASRAPVFTVEDSDIIQRIATPSQDRAICCAHFVVRRSLIQGTHSALAVHNNATLIGNVIRTDGTDSHQSGLRVLKNTILRGNTITCTPDNPGTVESNCSGHGVFYREGLGGNSLAAYNLTIENNYFKRDPLGGPFAAMRFIDCAAYTDCVNLKVTGNLFSLGEGTDADEFPVNSAGNVWSGNYWTDGTLARSGQSR